MSIGARKACEKDLIKILHFVPEKKAMCCLMESKNRFDRMEFMFSQSGSYTFIDLDHAVSDGTITGQHLWRN
jgi:hypothetical protein